jgi:hypothetical protein
MYQARTNILSVRASVSGGSAHPDQGNLLIHPFYVYRTQTFSQRNPTRETRRGHTYTNRTSKTATQCKKNEAATAAPEPLNAHHPRPRPTGENGYSPDFEPLYGNHVPL